MESKIISVLYPEVLTAIFGADAPNEIFAAGNTDLLDSHKIGLFVSVNCPGAMIFQSYDFITKIRKKDLCVISGFHSPMEKECLRSLSAGTAGIIYCLAKSLESFKLPEELERSFDDNRLLLLSVFPEKVKRITKETAHQRNKITAALADEVFLSYASSGGNTEKFCDEILQWGKPVFTLDAPENQGIIERGALTVDVNNISSYWP